MAFFVAGLATIAIAVGEIYTPAGLLAAGAELVLAGAYLRGGS